MQKTGSRLRLPIWGLIVAAIAIFFWYISRPEPVDVSVVKVSRGMVERTVANTRAGTVKACQRSKLSLPIGGQITELLVHEGDRVESGQLLMSLWNEDLVAQEKQASAQVESSRFEQKSICIAAASDEREARRLVGLRERKLASEEQADLARSKANASAAACEAAKARVAQMNSALEVAASLVEKTHLVAPFSGIVAEVTGEIGEYSTPSPPGVATPPAVDLLTHKCHYVSAPIDEVDASDITVGLQVRITLDAFRGKVFPSKVRRIAPYVLDIEKQARTVEVEADLEPMVESGAVMLAGYSADMEILLETREGVLRVPTELILEDRFVMVVDEDGLLQKRQIERGISNWRFTEVLSGLSEGGEIVSSIGDAGVTVGAPARILRDGND